MVYVLFFQATKKETVKEDLEEADNKVEQSRDLLAIEMFNILSKENEFSEYILQLLKLQRGYHESALKNLETVIPQLEKKIGTSYCIITLFYWVFYIIINIVLWSPFIGVTTYINIDIQVCIKT